MKVWELLESFAGCNSDAEVYISYSDGKKKGNVITLMPDMVNNINDDVAFIMTDKMITTSKGFL